MDDTAPSLSARVQALGQALRAQGWRIATAESCTGGLIAAACTAAAGSSDWFERGVVSYGNAAKVSLLGVEPALIARHGAVSEAVARAMALGALGVGPSGRREAETGGGGGAGDGSAADAQGRAAAGSTDAALPPDGPRVRLAVAVTGIAGPGGAVPGKPVGTVWLAWARQTAADTPPTVEAECLHLPGDRDAVRTATVHAALAGLLARATSVGPDATAQAAPGPSAATAAFDWNDGTGTVAGTGARRDADLRAQPVTVRQAPDGSARLPPAPGIRADPVAAFGIAAAGQGDGAGELEVLLEGDWSDEAEHARWRDALRTALPDVRWIGADAPLARRSRAVAAVVANPRPGTLQGLPALRFVQSLWAGVDRLLADPTLPADVTLARMVDPAMTAAMAETATWAVLALHRGFFAYARRQREGVWRVHAQRRADEVPVLLLGRGELARAVAARLSPLGYPVAHWHRDSGTDAASHAARLQPRVVVNLLPLTPATRGVLAAPLFDALPRGAGIVNLARGAHLIEADLLAALDDGRVGQAVLDVFSTEPLPTAHPFWHHPRVTVLPHAAALTDPRSAAAVVARNLAAFREGRTPSHTVDRARGY